MGAGVSGANEGNVNGIAVAEGMVVVGRVVTGGTVGIGLTVAPVGATVTGGPLVGITSLGGGVPSVGGMTGAMVGAMTGARVGGTAMGAVGVKESASLSPFTFPPSSAKTYMVPSGEIPPSVGIPTPLLMDQSSLPLA